MIEIQPQELNQAPLIPGTEPKSPSPGLVKRPSSTAADVADQPSPKQLPKQCVPEKTPVGIALSRLQRAIVGFHMTSLKFKLQKYPSY